MRVSNLLIIPTSILLIGCSSTLSPTIQDYTIYPNSVKTTPSTIHSTITLRLSTTKTVPSLSSKNIYYIHTNGESGNYLYSRWSDTPAQLIERSLIASLHDQALFNSLIPATSTAQAEWILESDLHAFYHHFISNTQSEGVIDITYRVIDTKTKHLIRTQRFFITIPASSNDASGGINALNLGTKTLVTQCTLWLSNAIKTAPIP